MRPESKVMAQRWARKQCVKRVLRKYRAWGNVWFKRQIPDEYTERAAVDEALREEQTKRGLR